MVKHMVMRHGNYYDSIWCSCILSFLVVDIPCWHMYYFPFKSIVVNVVVMATLWSGFSFHNRCLSCGLCLALLVIASEKLRCAISLRDVPVGSA